MDGVFQFFKHIAENYGPTFAILFLLIVLILFGMYFLITTFPDVIREYIENKIDENKEAHLRGTTKRKNISPQVNKILSELIVKTNGDRALLFEFSNGKSNLAGLPFLYLNATSESLSYGTSSVAHLYQRINISLFANFMLELETNNYFYECDVENIKFKYPFIYNFLQPNGVKSMLFYSIYGIDETLGFIILTSVNDKNINKKKAMPIITESAQMISSLLNLEDLKKKK